MTRPMSEETPEQLAQRVVDTWGEGNPPIVILARALLSTSSAERGMREALEKIAHEPQGDPEATHAEVLEAVTQISKDALVEADEKDTRK